jgi:2-polyprenyl-3-methyl-5-hydroxy-6-metoxy-1,4-benzoquinol methylase
LTFKYFSSNFKALRTLNTNGLNMISTSSNNTSSKICPLCSSSKLKILLNLKPRYQVKSSLGVPSTARIIFACNNCDAFFSDDSSSVTDQKIDEIYDETYHDSLTGSVKNENQSGVMEQNALRLKLLKEYAPEGDLLDIGCNTGHFLSTARDTGYKVYGLEPSLFASKLARERFDYGEDRIETATVFESK